MTFAASPRLRCLAVWLAASAVAVTALAVLLADVRRPWPASFDELLVRVAQWALLGCGGWLWAASTAVVVEALHAAGSRDSGPPRRPTPGVPAALRRIVLAACGAAVVTGLAAPVMAHTPASPAPPASTHHRGDRVDRLPFPARVPASAPPHVVVRPGDTLWGLAVDRLGRGAPASAVSAEWHRIYARNRAVIGADPALIEPGARLVVGPVVDDE